MRNNMVQIDGNSLKSAIKKNNMTSAGLSREIGRGQSYIANCLDRGVMSRYALELLSRILRTNISDLMPKTGRDTSGFKMNLDVKPDKVYLEVLFDGQVIGSAYSKIKGQTEVDLMQAISYAAHMIYKFAEQKRLECE